MKPERFTIDVSAADLKDLRKRLRRTRLAGDSEGNDWRYGVPSSWLAPLLAYWADGFDWRAQERAINRHVHSRVEIDDTPLHFMRVPGRGPKPMPLILTHGWPWTFWDWSDAAQRLADPGAYGGDPDDAFDVIIPSLPGFGFSNPLRSYEVNVREIGRLWVRLMRDALGYRRFMAAGGDWGSMVTAELGHAYPQHIVAAHLTLPLLPGLDIRTLKPDRYAADEAWMPMRNAAARAVCRSHVAVHGTDHQTLAYALNDSPAGMAAWIWERRHNWSSPGSVGMRDPDRMCTLASLYWFTRSIESSMRLYAAHKDAPWTSLHDGPRLIDVPTGFAVAPDDLMLIPRALAAEWTNLARWTIFPSGGHFLPVEEPDLLVEEYRALARPLR